jgi:pyruvate/2-oxoacid:ferredoxin oxidoreductase beta subunit
MPQRLRESIAHGAVTACLRADEDSIKLARMAVLTRVFPLMEVENGTRWRFTMDHPGDPVRPYIRMQGRSKHLTDEQIDRIQVEADARWEELTRRVRHGV